MRCRTLRQLIQKSKYFLENTFGKKAFGTEKIMLYFRENLKSSTNSAYWLKKIQRNIDRDMEITKQLYSLGWTVIRFWGKDIIQNPEECVQTIEDAILEQKIQQIESRQPLFPPQK